MSRANHEWGIGYLAHVVFNLSDYCQEDYLEDSRVAGLMEQFILNLQDKYVTPVYAYCVMPGHVHIVLKFNADPAKVMQFLKGASAFQINKLVQRRGTLWQASTHDQIIRSKEQFLNACFYVWQNPVKAKLVSSPSEYQYSDYKKMHRKIYKIADALFA